MHKLWGSSKAFSSPNLESDTKIFYLGTYVTIWTESFHINKESCSWLDHINQSINFCGLPGHIWNLHRLQGCIGGDCLKLEFCSNKTPLLKYSQVGGGCVVIENLKLLLPTCNCSMGGISLLMLLLVVSTRLLTNNASSCITCGAWGCLCVRMVFPVPDKLMVNCVMSEHDKWSLVSYIWYNVMLFCYSFCH